MQDTGKYPVFLVILDGFGYTLEENGNAIAHADMSNWDNFLQRFPYVLLDASGKSVGLPDGFIGNSEVGHTTLGAGRIVQTALCKFHNAIKDGSFFKNDLLISQFERLKSTNHALHVMGLLSDAGVHTHMEQVYAIIRLAKQVGVPRVYVHAFLDGRDVSPKSAHIYLKQLNDFFRQEQFGSLASLHGRFYAMDRDKNWDRTKKSFNVLIGKQKAYDKGWQELLENSYRNSIADEFFEPALLDEKGIIKPGDGIFFFNFRPDRARQLAACFLEDAIAPQLSFFISTTRYDKKFAQYDNQVLFEEEPIKNTFLEVIARQKTHNKIFTIAETEKYAHVTYFLHGTKERAESCEEQVLIPSIKAQTYVEYPEMSAPKITDRIVQSLKDDPADVYVVNYANCDMVGHSGDFAATVKACECVDIQLGRLYAEVIEKRNGTLFIVADHGNAEEMLDKIGHVKTAHTTNPVPFMLISKAYDGKMAQMVFPQYFDGKQRGLCRVAPTILAYLNIQVPDDMACRPLGFVIS